MDSDVLGGSGNSVVGVITAKVDIFRSQGDAKPRWPSSIGAGLGDQMLAGHGQETNMRNMTSDAECPSNSHVSGILESIAVEDFDAGTSNSCLSQVNGGKKLHQRPGKVGRSNSGSSKRSRIAQMEVSVNETGVEDVHGKPQLVRQKSTTNGKRREKRNGKLPKSRSDPLSLKIGLVSFSSVAGGGNFLAYGRKSSNFDASNHVGDLPLDELLDGSYNCQSLVKDKGKAVENVEDNLLNSIRKAFSVLRVQSPVHTQQTGELEQVNDHKASDCSITDGASPESRNNDNGGCEAGCAVNEPSINKDSIPRTEVLSTLDDSPLHEPRDVLRLLMLPPPKELDTLLLDAVKPALSSKNIDLRLGKTASHRTGMPPFSWSLNPSGHSKSGPDATKLAANRPSCQGRWLKVENTLVSPKGSTTGFLVDFETLTFDHSLVPIANQQLRPSEKKIGASFISSDQVGSSSAACPAPQMPPAVEHSSGFWDAAETLYEIASQSPEEGTDNIVEELEKAQKPMDTSNLKPDAKSGRLVAASAPSKDFESQLKNSDSTYPSKKLKLLANGHAGSVCHSKAVMKSPFNWSAPRSIRSSTGKLSRDSNPQSKHPRSSIMKKPRMMPPPSRIMDKTSSNQLKLKGKLQTGTN